jgi:hypothetical protein
MLFLLFWLVGAVIFCSLWALVGWQLSRPRCASRAAAHDAPLHDERFALSFADEVLDLVETPNLG